MLEDVLKQWGGSEVSAYDVYADMYHFGEGYIQRSDEEPGQYKANPLAYYRMDGKKTGHYRIVFEDTFDELLPELQAADFCIMNGLSYFGRKNVLRHASKMFALIFDLDGVTDKTLYAFMSGAVRAQAYPVPNYIILSGHGVHLYYIFETPIPLFPNLKFQLKEFKYELTEKMWNPYTSTEEKPQIQGINQGFRVIGGKTKKGAPLEKSKAFLINPHPFNLDQLSDYVTDDKRIDEKKLFGESKMSLDEAKEKYPEWYNEVVLGKKTYRKRWEIEKKVHGENPYALYDWWLDKIRKGAAYKHRYFCIMCLVIYGVKCGVPEKKVTEDALGLVDFLNGLNPEHPFTKEDVSSALELYDLKYCTFPIKDIAKLSGINIERNRRNGRTQENHLKIARRAQEIDDPDGSWRNKDGRPVGSGTKKKIVKAYLKKHPDSRPAEIAKALDISRTTVYKYLREEEKPEKEKVKKPLSDKEKRNLMYKAYLDRIAAMMDQAESELETEIEKQKSSGKNSAASN